MIGLLIGIAVLAVIIERLWPAAELPKVKGWWARVALINICQLGIIIVAGLTWDKWLAETSIFSIRDHMGPIPAALVTYLVSCFIFYWWHRFRHESKWLWKVCHQIHHSPRRLEVLTSFYKHPVEITLNSILTGLIVYGLLAGRFRDTSCFDQSSGPELVVQRSITEVTGLDNQRAHLVFNGWRVVGTAYAF